MIVAYLLLAAAAIAAAGATSIFFADSLARRNLINNITDAESRTWLGTVRARLDKSLMRTRLGLLLSIALEEVGKSRFRSIDALFGIFVAMLVIFGAVGNLLSWTLAPVIALLVIPLVIGLVRRAQTRRREKFIAQMPQLARVLSNASSAGLALRTAIELASEELPQPAAAEMGRVAQSLAVGESIEGALTNLERRLPSREVVVLVSTLIVSARAGGSLISSLRRIAETLDERKQTRREIMTALAEAKSTALLIPIIGVVSLFMLRSIDKDAIDEMLSRTLGQVIFVAAAVMYALGFFLFRRITRVDV